MDKLLLGSRMNDSSVTYKQKEEKVNKKDKQTVKDSKEAENTANAEKTSMPGNVEEESETIKDLFEKQREEQEKNGWDYFFEQMRRSKERAKIYNALSYSPSKDLIRIASASNISSVNSVTALIRIRMSKVRRCGAKPEEIAAALGQMSSVIKKASVKVGRLRGEMQIEHNRKLAEDQRNELEEEKLERELRRKKRFRMTQENVDIIEAKDGYPYVSGSGVSVPVITPMPLASSAVIDTVSTGDVGTAPTAATMDFKL